MARHHLIANDLKLFLSASANDFKKKISSRVYSPWQKSTDERGFCLIHMILAHAIELAKKDEPQTFDWKSAFAKLEDANYQFSSSDYFPPDFFCSWFFSLSLDDKAIEVYLAMIKALHVGGIDVEQADLIKFLKKTRHFDAKITDFFTLSGFDLTNTLREISVERDIATLTNSSFERVRFNPEVTITCYNEEQLAAKLVEYKEEQQVKMNNIRSYLDSTQVSEERARELYKCFKVSYEKMETYPEFKGKYLVDICLDYGMANCLKTEAFFTDAQVEMIHLLEEKSNIQFIEPHKNKDHMSKNRNAQRRPSWD